MKLLVPAAALLLAALPPGTSRLFHATATAAAPAPEVPYVPTPEPLVEAMLDLAELTPDDRLLDLGSGDGRIAIAAARRGAHAEGVEIDESLVARSAQAARNAGVDGRAFFHRGDLFAVPIAQADVVTLYLLPDVNLRLRPRLLTELRPGTRVVSHAFTMGDWRPDAERQLDGRNIYLWIVPAVAEGRWLLTAADGRVVQLDLEQHFQEVAGTATRDGQAEPLTGVTLRGDRLRFTAGGRVYAAFIDGAVMRPDPDERGETGWTAEKTD